MDTNLDNLNLPDDTNFENLTSANNYNGGTYKDLIMLNEYVTEEIMEDYHSERSKNFEEEPLFRMKIQF